MEVFLQMDSFSRAMKEQELDTPSIEKRFAYTFLQQLITYVDEAQEHMLEFGEHILVSSAWHCFWTREHFISSLFWGSSLSHDGQYLFYNY